MMSSVKEEKLIDVLATKYAIEGLSASLKPFLFKIPVLGRGCNGRRIFVLPLEEEVPKAVSGLTKMNSKSSLVASISADLEEL
jgi:hypothetical protein